MVQTTDFFYPLVDSPYLQGKIACSNVLSDLYAMGVPYCDNMLMLLGIPTKMSAEERNVVVPQLMRGFKDQAELAGTRVTGGQTVMNPWCIIGGVATSVTDVDSLILPHSAKARDILVLTKPLGTQVAVNAKQWLMENDYDWLSKIEAAGDNAAAPENISRLYRDAKVSMTELNQVSAKLMIDYNAKCATDVTGFGLFGHAENLCKSQHEKNLQFVINTLPILEGAKQLDEALSGMFKLEQGFSAETSGGLLIAFPPSSVDGFVQEFHDLIGRECWIIGSVRATEDSTSSVVFESPKVLEVNFDSLFSERGRSTYVPGHLSVMRSTLSEVASEKSSDCDSESTEK